MVLGVPIFKHFRVYKGVNYERTVNGVNINFLLPIYFLGAKLCCGDIFNHFAVWISVLLGALVGDLGPSGGRTVQLLVILFSSVFVWSTISDQSHCRIF